jgi:hypothetical protein
MFRPLEPSQNALCAGREYHIQLLSPRTNLLVNPPICLPAHPLRLKWRWRIRTDVIRAELAVQAGEVLVRAIYWAAALDRIAETVAMPAGEKPAANVELGNAPAAMHAVARHGAD